MLCEKRVIGWKEYNLLLLDGNQFRLNLSQKEPIPFNKIWNRGFSLKTLLKPST